MEAVLKNGVSDCNSFISSIDSLEKRLNEQLLFLEEQNAIEQERCDLKTSDLIAECAQLESQIRSVVTELQKEEAQTERIRTENLDTRQNVQQLQTECSDLEASGALLQAELNKERTQLPPRQDVVVWNPTEITSVTVPGSVFDNILGFLGTRNLFLLECVNREWCRAISSWPGWFQYQEYLPGAHSFNISAQPLRHHFPRFIMSIELDQRRSLWNVSVEGKELGDHSPPQTKSNNAVMMDISQDSRELSKEYNVCDVILSTNQKLAQIKVDTSRLQAKLSNNETIKRGYKLQTDAIGQEITKLMRKNHHLETQLQSDQHTCNYLQLRTTQLGQEYKDLSSIPVRMQQKHNDAEEEMENEVDSLRFTELKGQSKEITKIKKEKEVLAREIRKAEVKLKEVTEERDNMKKLYVELKEQLAIMSL